jgi:hypothetical protein
MFRTRINLEISASVGFYCKETFYNARSYEHKIPLVSLEPTKSLSCLDPTECQTIRLMCLPIFQFRVIDNKKLAAI